MAVQWRWPYTAVHSALCRNRFSDLTQGHGMLLRGLVFDVLGEGRGRGMALPGAMQLTSCW